MVFKRNAELNLLNWKENPNRKPLIIRGARQVGKTTLIKEFAKSYRFSIQLNLDKSSDLEFFESYKQTDTLLESLLLSRNLSMSNIGETLLFIDEIQESPEAIQLLRYLYEEFPELHVIAAGSLLEFAMKKVKNFPVGRVEFLYLHPLNFEEYLKAINHQEAVKQLNKIPFDSFAHKTLIELFNRYTITGGMPEVISIYIEKNSLSELPRVYESIWGTYKNDVEKYATNETERKVLIHIMSTAHLYVDQRIKFQNFGQSTYKSREVGQAFRNLNDAKVIRLIYPTIDVELPVKPDIRKSPRLQFLDTGLLNYELGIQANLLAYSDLSDSFKGAIIPHMITQELISINTLNNKTPHFWIREKKQSSAEVDLVYSYEDKVIPIEIKSGKEGTLKSLHQFIDRSNHPYAIRLYGGELVLNKTRTPGGKPYFLLNLPYFLGSKIPDYVQYLVTLHPG